MQTGTITAKPKAFFSANLADKTFRGYTIQRQDDGTAIVKDVKVFKVGTFRDSWGDQHTWTAEHLQQMVDNFVLLRAKDIFADVPVRRDHSNSIDKVTGYFESTRADQQFLYADIHMTDANSMNKMVSGAFRNVSLEVGMFVANDESAYWPVIYGVAFVDIPAVEGLHSKNAQVSYFSQTLEKEAPVGTATEGTQPNTGSVTINLNGQSNLVPDPKPTDGPAPHAAPAGGAPVATAPVAPTAFRLNGAESTDYTRVQAHIGILEAFRTEMFEQGRKDFVAKLVTDNKITKAQEEDLASMAVTLSETQFAQFTKGYESAPVLSVLQSHGSSQTDQNAPGNAEEGDVKRDYQEQIDMFRRAGKPEAWIANTKAAVSLAALNAKS